MIGCFSKYDIFIYLNCLGDLFFGSMLSVVVIQLDIQTYRKSVILQLLQSHNLHYYLTYKAYKDIHLHYKRQFLHMTNVYFQNILMESCFHQGPID